MFLERKLLFCVLLLAGCPDGRSKGDRPDARVADGEAPDDDAVVDEQIEPATSADGGAVDARGGAPSAVSDASPEPDAAAGYTDAAASSMDAATEPADAGLDAYMTQHDAALDAGTAPDASLDATPDATIDDGAAGDTGGSGDSGSLSDATSPDGGSQPSWPSGCTVYRLTAAQPVWIEASRESLPQIHLNAPWGNVPAQALAFRSIPESAALRDMRLTSASTGATLVQSDGLPVQTPPLPADIGLYLPSGSNSLHLSLHYDNRLGAAHEDRSGFEVCVVTGTNVRPTTAGLAVLLPIASPMVPPRVESHEVTSTCQLGTQPVRILGVQPFAFQRAVGARLVLEESARTLVIHDAAYAATKLWPISPAIEPVTGSKLTATCRYANPSAQTFSFGERSDDELCLLLVLHAPRGSFSCSTGGFPGGALGGGMQ